MKDGFIAVAAATPTVVVADCEANAAAIIAAVNDAAGRGAKVIALPELCVTGYTCSDLFWQKKLLDDAYSALERIARETKSLDALIFVGLPLRAHGKLYNVAAACAHGRVIGFVPKQNLPAYNEFYETRHFTPGKAT